MKSEHSLAKQSVTLVNYLAKHPGSDKWQLQDALNRVHGDKASMTQSVVCAVRRIAGEEVLTCMFDRKVHAYVYRLALDAQEGMRYVTNRKLKVRNETRNLVAILDRIEDKWPGDVEVRYARTLLNSVAEMLSVQ